LREKRAPIITFSAPIIIAKIGGSVMWLEKGIGEDKRWFYPISALMIGTAILLTQLWPLFYPHIQAHFNLETTATIVLAATFSGIGSMIVGPPIIGAILDKYGPKIPFIMSAITLIIGHNLIIKMLSMSDWSKAMYIWYLATFLIGLGGGFYSGTFTATVGKWFPDRLGTAMGISVAGTGSAVVLYSPLLGAYIKKYGFSGNIFLMFTFMAIVFLGLGILLWKSPPKDWHPTGMQQRAGSSATKNKGATRDYTLQEAVRDKRFWLLYLCFICSSFSYMFFIQNASMIILEGLGKVMDPQVVLVSIIPAFMTVGETSGLIGRFSWGIITDKLGGPWRTLWIVYFFPAIVMILFYLGYHSVILIFLTGFLFYFGSSGESVIHYAIVPYVFGRKHLGKVMSIINSFSVGLGVAFGPFVGAYIKDLTGGYYWALVLAVCIRLCGTVFALLGLRMSLQQEKAGYTIIETS